MKKILVDAEAFAKKIQKPAISTIGKVEICAGFFILASTAAYLACDLAEKLPPSLMQSSGQTLIEALKSVDPVAITCISCAGIAILASLLLMAHGYFNRQNTEVDGIKPIIEHSPSSPSFSPSPSYYSEGE